MEGYRKELGRMGEDAACGHLKKKGYRILERNFLIRGGELDIIAGWGEYIVFVEVKTRSGLSCGSGAEAVGYIKQQRMRKAALVYLQRCGYERAVRFDVVEVLGSVRFGRFFSREINHIENAF